MNGNALDFFHTLAKKDGIEPDVVKFSKSNDFSAFDMDFVKPYLGCSVDWLDVGAGTGLLINGLHQKVRNVVAIEPVEEFSNFIVKAENVSVINETHSGYIEKYADTPFELITCFGFIQYLNTQEARDFYKKFYPLLKENGKFIVKNQFGVQGDVVVDTFSEALQSVYYSEYRTLEHEKKLMAEAGFKNFEVVDIYPPECSKWDNTHYFAIVAEK